MSLKEALYHAQNEYGCFDRSLRLAVKVTLAEVVGDCLPKGTQEAELSWRSVECSVFDSNENGD